MMRVGRDYYEYLTPEACDHLIEHFRSIAPQLEGKNYAQGPEGPHVGPVTGFEPKPVAPQPAPAATSAAADEPESTDATTTEGSA